MQSRIRWGAAVSILLLGQAAVPDPLQQLSAHWAALKDVKTLSARFVCEKNLAALETPLNSEGRLWILKKDADKDNGAVRFSTETPYISELILADGKVFARSQHEEEWTKTNQASRPGLTAVMGQLGGWSTGDTSKIADMYAVTIGDPANIPPAPGAKTERRPIDAFLLTPTNKDLAKAVKQVTLALDSTSHYLYFIEITTQQDDITRYWFVDVQTNSPLPTDVFKPDGALVMPEDRKP